MRLLRAQILLQVWILLLACQVLIGSITESTSKTAAISGLLLLFGGIASLSAVTRTGFWSPGTLFLVVLGLFHLGLTPFWILNIDPDLPLNYDDIWYEGPPGALALEIVGLAITAYVIGVLCAILWSNRGEKTELKETILEIGSSNFVKSPFEVAGPILLLLSVLIWAVLAIRAGGLGIFFSSYNTYLSATGSLQLGYVYFMVGIGFALTMAQPILSTLAKVAVASFVLFALFAFFIGLRGEVLFPTVVGISVLAFRRKMPGFFVTTFLLFGVLSLINLAREVRKAGLGAFGLSWYDVSPLSALAELGSSIRVVAVVVNWHHFSNEQFSMGKTYGVSILRLFESFSIRASQIPAGEDYRLMNVEIADRAGNIGGSIVAEAYHNFAIVGVVIVLTVFGAMFGVFSMRRHTFESIAIYAVIANTVFNHIRNSFVPVIPMSMFGLLLVLGILILAKQSQRAIRHDIQDGAKAN